MRGSSVLECRGVCRSVAAAGAGRRDHLLVDRQARVVERFSATRPSMPNDLMVSITIR
jgi:hypothetical protein